jgi:putative ABC transport system ATP-binding protein/lipoprotein-releasing system ATP-binding protein
MPLIECRNLIKSFGEPPVSILKGVSYSVEPGEFVAITGRSGSGKSTLLYATSGLDTLSSGEVLISGKDINKMNNNELHEYRNKKMGFVFQFHYLLPELTSLENILMPARKFRLEKQKAERAHFLMDQFKVTSCKNKFPSQMSGGEQQRVSLARSLIMEPQILFADEPTGNLDSVNGDIVMGIFESINSQHSVTIMLVTHEPDYAARASRQIHIADGNIVGDDRRERGSM